MADGSVCVCVCERSVWTLIAAQALMVRAQLCDSAEYWSRSNFSWSDPCQPDNTEHTHTYTSTFCWFQVQKLRRYTGQYRSHFQNAQALASDWLTGLIASDWVHLNLIW